jgi:hypothetical protein
LPKQLQQYHAKPTKQFTLHLLQPTVVLPVLFDLIRKYVPLACLDVRNTTCDVNNAGDGIGQFDLATK